MAGFTAVRDLGGSGVNMSLRNAINGKRNWSDSIRLFCRNLATDDDPTENISTLQHVVFVMKYGQIYKNE